MTLDEAIKHCEDVAAKCFVERSARNHSGKCGFEHLELAAWLRELKTYKEQEPCEDAISREAALMCMTGKYIVDLEYKPDDIISQHIKRIKALPSVIPKQKTGHWFYDKSIENWRCSECKETPKTMGYCGSANFMVEHFKFCNHCGAKMVEPQKREDAGGFRLRWQKEKAKWDAERIGEE
jgi:hypothetical protein